MNEATLNQKEQFVLDINKKKFGGFYLELGGSHSTENSNTHKLETYYNWKGLALEIVPELQEEYSLNRKNPCLLADAMSFNYLEYFEQNNVPKQIDFLSINIDTGYNDNTGRLLGNPAQSLLGLIALPLSSYRFTVITFEHEALQDYKNGAIRDAQREILNALGYSLVVREWAEDWWVDPAIMPYSEYKNFYKIKNC